MPLRKDLKSVLLIGSGPIVIGQACEFDYSGTQAVKALREEGLRLILVNSNPATIMTDPELADRTYIEPMTVAVLTKIIEHERPDALLPTVGGQTALNLAIELAEAGSVFFTRPHLSDYMADAGEIRSRAADLFAAVESKELIFAIHGVMPLEDAVEAHRLMEGRSSRGKLLLSTASKGAQTLDPIGHTQNT